MEPADGLLTAIGAIFMRCWHGSCRASNGCVVQVMSAACVQAVVVGVEEVMSVHYLERIEEGGQFVRARVMVERNGLSYAEIFEIGEPVHLNSIGIKVADESYLERVYWIQGFSEAWGRAKVMVTRGRGGGPGEHAIPIRELVKVPAIQAVDCSAAAWAAGTPGRNGPSAVSARKDPITKSGADGWRTCSGWSET